MIFCKILFAIVFSHFLMLGVIYAYMEEYKHNDCFFKYGLNVQYVQNKTS